MHWTRLREAMDLFIQKKTEIDVVNSAEVRSFGVTSSGRVLVATLLRVKKAYK